MAVIFGDLKLWGVDILRRGLAGRATVVGQKPAKVIGPVVWVESDGGRRSGATLEGAFLRINTFAPTRDAAHDLARLCEPLLRPDGAPVTDVERTTGPNEIVDEGATYHRFYSLYAVTARGKEYP